MMTVAAAAAPTMTTRITTIHSSAETSYGHYKTESIHHFRVLSKFLSPLG